MTLIVNVLHKDFSLVAADKLANATGPTTITFTHMTISMPNGGRIEGVVRKIVTNATGGTVVGIAGTVSEHKYIDKFKKATNSEEALATVRASAHDFFDFAERDQIINCTSQMSNASIISFFDAEKSVFWSFIIKYSRFEFHQFVYARKKHPRAYVFSIGSGNPTLTEKIPADEINRFSASIAENWNEPQLALWLDDVFQTVSDNNKTVSASYEAVIATRDNPIFRPLTRETSELLK